MTDLLARLGIEPDEVNLLDGTDARCAPVHSLWEAARCRHTAALIQRFCLPRFSRTPTLTSRGMPTPSAHTNKVLNEWIHRS
jgi:crotonobetainyl-CoA:carnitine CoA-transferase CaiB-like acyl-CoA transferase